MKLLELGFVRVTLYRAAAISAAIGTIIMLAACTTSVTVQGTVPTPLVNRIPASIGVHYPDEFRSYVYTEAIKDSGTWNIDLGNQNLSFFRNLMGALFESVEEVGEPPLAEDTMASLDGILIPRIHKYGFLTPSISGLKFYSASIEYRIELLDRDLNRIGNWRIIGYGKSEGGMFSSDDALNEATMLAIRDGGARIAIELIEEPSVKNWIESMEAVEPKAGSVETNKVGSVITEGGD